MSYSNGQNSVFLNLSNGSKNAQSTDTLNQSGTSTLRVNYLVKGADGAASSASTSVTVGTGTNYSNTADGLISAINNAGLGITADFATQSQAGVAGGGTQTGIQISGGLVSVGVDPNAASTSGTLNPSEITSGDLALNQTITVKAGAATAAVVTIDQTNNTLAGLANAINSGTGGAGGVTATVVYNSSGVATSLQLADSTSTGGELSVTTASASVVPNALTPGSVIAASSNPSTASFAAGATGAVGVQGTATLSIGGAGSNDPTQALSGSITLSNGTNTKTFVMGGTAGVSGNTVTLGAGTSTLNDLAAAITANLGATAVANSSGISISSTATGTNISMGQSSLKANLSAAVTTNVAGLAATSGTSGSTVLSMSNTAAFKSDGSDALTGLIKLQNGGGQQYTFTMGSSAGYNAGTHTYTTGTSDVSGLVNEINASTANTGMTATIANGTIEVGSNIVNTTITASNSTLAGTTTLASDTGGGSPAFGTGKTPSTDVYSTVNILTGTGNPGDNSLTTTGDSLAGSMSITNGGVTKTFTMGTGTNAGNQIFTGASTLASLQSAINGAGLSVTATADATPGATSSGLTLTANAYGTDIVVGGTGIVATSTLGTNVQGAVGAGAAQYLTSTLSTDNNGKLDTTGATSEFSGSFTIGQTGTLINSGSAATLTVVVGAANKTSSDNDLTHVYVQGTAAGGNAGTATMAQIRDAINNYTAAGNSAVNTKAFDVSASVDANTGGLTLQAGDFATNDSALSITGSTLVANQTLTAGTLTHGSIAGEAQVALVNSQGGPINGTDTLTEGTSIVLTNSASGVATTFTMGGVTSGSTIGVGTAGNQGSQTVQALMTAIGAAGLDLQAGLSNGKLTIASTGPGNTGTVTVGGATNLSFAFTATGTSSTAGTAATGPTAAAVTINTSAGMSTTGADALGGQIILTNSSNGTAVTFNMGGTAGTSGNVVTLGAGTSTVNDLVDAINNNGMLGVTASVNSTSGALQLQSNTTNTTITVGGTGLTDATSEVLTPGTSAQPSANSTGTLSLASGNFTGADKLGGSISVTANGSTTNYVMAGSTATFASGTVVHLNTNDSTVAGFEAALSANQGLTTSVSNGVMTLTSGSADANPIAVTNNNLSDSLGHAPATASLGNFTSLSDMVSGQLKYSTGGQNYDIGNGNLTGMTVQQLLNNINYGNSAGTGVSGVNGVTATWIPSANDSSQYGTNQFGSIQLASNTFGASGNIVNYSSGTTINDLNTSATLSYAGGSAYDTGISNDTLNGVYDSSTNQSAPAGASTNLASSASGSSGIATISYSHGAGQSLSATSLTNQDAAKDALTAINQAISNVAAQDGYIGAMINTLNSVSQVLATQSENVQSAQNAVQATDYASAASNMSKYQILSQTGISALAQANSMQQEVLKLLQ